MTTDDAEDLVAFQDVRVIGSTAPALLCLPRGHLRSPLRFTCTWCEGIRRS